MKRILILVLALGCCTAVLASDVKLGLIRAKYQALFYLTARPAERMMVKYRCTDELIKLYSEETDKLLSLSDEEIRVREKRKQGFLELSARYDSAIKSCSEGMSPSLVAAVLSILQIR
jgi:hypothetical protein